jgi:hypothetical protein
MPSVYIPFPADPSFAETCHAVVALQRFNDNDADDPFEPYPGHESEPCSLTPLDPREVVARGLQVGTRVYRLGLLRPTPLRAGDRLVLHPQDDPDRPPVTDPPRVFGVIGRPTTAGGLPYWQTEVQEVEGGPDAPGGPPASG